VQSFVLAEAVPHGEAPEASQQLQGDQVPHVRVAIQDEFGKPSRRILIPEGILGSRV